MSDFLLIEGFDYYNTAGTGDGGVLTVWGYGGSGEYDIIAGRDGGQCLRLGDITGGTRYLERFLPEDTNSSFSVGFAMRRGTDGGAMFFRLAGGVTNAAHIELRTSGSTDIGVYAGGVLVGLIPTIFPISTDWFYVELVGTIAPAGGRLEVWVDDTKYIDFTGDTSSHASDHTYGRVLLRCPDGGGSSNWFYFDDIYINKVATRLGEMRIDYHPVSADTAQKDMTPSTGATNYNLLDEIPVATADYVTGAATGDQDIYDLLDIAVDEYDIKAVQPVILAGKTDAGSRQIIVQGISGASEDANTVSLITAPNYRLLDPMDVDPATAAAWTFAGFNALQLGIEVGT